MRPAFRALTRAIPLCIVCLALSLPVQAASVAVHPLIVPGGQGDEAHLYGPLLMKALAKRGIQPAAPEAVARFLEKHPGCEDEGCLGELARAAGVERALFVSVSPYIREPLFSAQLVSHNGVEVDTRTVSVLKKGRRSQAVIEEGLETLISQVRFDAPEPPAPAHPPASSPTVAQPSSPPKPPTLTPNVTPSATALASALPAPSQSPSGLRIASYVTAGVGALALIGGATIALAARSDRARLEQMLDANGFRPPTAEAASLDQSLHSRSQLTNGLLIGGGAALVASGAMFFLSRPSTEPSVSVTAGPDGAAAFVAGHF